MNTQNTQWKPSGPYGKSTCPERELWQQVIVRAILDAEMNIRKSPRQSEVKEDLRTRDEAREWLRGKTQDFSTVCHLAGFDPNFIRDRYAAGKIDIKLLRTGEKT
jgi:hypothetical protein